MPHQIDYGAVETSRAIVGRPMHFICRVQQLFVEDPSTGGARAHERYDVIALLTQRARDRQQFRDPDAAAQAPNCSEIVGCGGAAQRAEQVSERVRNPQ